MASDVSSGDAPSGGVSSGGGTATREPDTGFERQKSESLGLRIQHVLHSRPILGPLAVLLLSIIAFSIISGRFLSAANLGLVLAQVTVIAVLALGQTLVILTAGIDLSTGAITVFTSVIMANLTTKAGLPGGLALIVGFLCGLAMGAFTAFLDLALGLANPALGLLASRAGLGSLYLAGAITVLCAAPVAVFLLRGSSDWSETGARDTKIRTGSAH